MAEVCSLLTDLARHSTLYHSIYTTKATTRCVSVTLSLALPAIECSPHSRAGLHCLLRINHARPIVVSSTTKRWVSRLVGYASFEHESHTILIRLLLTSVTLDFARSETLLSTYSESLYKTWSQTATIDMSRKIV